MASSLDIPSIPLIDFSPFLHGSARDRAQVASSIDEAFQSRGFIYLSNHGIDQRKVDGCFELVRTFIVPVFVLEILSKR
jgi:isopenicillin N synthase-like dioxygenase